MLIIGTGGLAKDVIASMEQDLNDYAKDVIFYNNTSSSSQRLFDYYNVYNSLDDILEISSKKKIDFIVCIGNPLLRMRLTIQFLKLGLKNSNYISKKTCAISPFTNISEGVVIQQGVIVSRNVVLNNGVFVNANTVIGHDVKIGQYVSIGPGVRILGHAEIGEFSYIGTNAVILPGVKIGKMVRIGIGKIIDCDVPDNSKI
jgi:sugar O-acyltransferase (sialic acid O-acetyltransferase NeuD family)